MPRRRPHQPIFRKKTIFGSVATGNTPGIPAGPQSFVVPPASLTTTGVSPAVAAAGAASVTVPVGELTLTGVAPSVDTAGPQSITVPSADIALAGVTPVVATTGPPTTGLFAWWDPSDSTTVTESGGDVSQITDKSGNGNTLTSPSGDQPAINTSTLNGLPVLGFDGTEYLRAATAAPWKFIHDGSDAAIFVVVRPGVVSNPNVFYGLVGTGATASANVGFSLYFDDRSSVSRNDTWTLGVYRGVSGSLAAGFVAANGVLTPNAWHILEIRVDANDATTANRSDGRVDGGTLTTNDATFNGSASASNPTYAFEVGGAGNGVGLLVGAIAEVLVYNTALDATAMTAVRSYLEAKWAL